MSRSTAIESSDLNGFIGGSGRLYSYDSMGRIATNWQCTIYVCSYPLAYTYNYLGEVKTSTDGLGHTFTYNYTAAGRLSSLTSSLADAQYPATLMNNLHYGAFGPSGDTLGNGVNESFGYAARGFYNSYGSTPYSFNLSFANNGNITYASDTAGSGSTWSYGYDAFNRLASSNKNGGQQTFSYDYDRLGNRWHQNAPQGGPAPQYSFSGGNNRMDGYSYDAAGNLLNDTFHQYSYDAENRLKSVDNGAVSYIYDTSGWRVAKKTNGVLTAEYLYDFSGHQTVTLNGSTVVGEEIYAGGRHLGTYTPSTTNFVHSDWLGTKRVTTGPTGSPVESCANLPFGDGRNCTGTDLSASFFTDMFHDTESNTEHTWFRQLSTTQGRWLSPDPYAGSMDLTNPQSLNRYAYVMNNPMNGVDPTGLDAHSLECL